MLKFPWKEGLKKISKQWTTSKMYFVEVLHRMCSFWILMAALGRDVVGRKKYQTGFGMAVLMNWPVARHTNSPGKAWRRRERRGRSFPWRKSLQPNDFNFFIITWQTKTCWIIQRVRGRWNIPWKPWVVLPLQFILGGSSHLVSGQ